jgi:hypothetical protein
MPELKKISLAAVPRALQKAERYRLLNQSWATESICLDILEVDPTNQQVIVMLILALTDQFGDEPRGLARRARNLLERVTDPYQRAYYHGIIYERLGHAELATQAVHAHALAHEAITKAMSHFEEAERLRPSANDDAILRWNTCARTLANVRNMKPDEVTYEPSFGE